MKIAVSRSIRRHSPYNAPRVPPVPGVPELIQVQGREEPATRSPSPPNVRIVPATPFIGKRSSKQLIQHYQAREHLAPLVDRQIIPELFLVDANKIAYPFIADTHAISVDCVLGYAKRWKLDAGGTITCGGPYRGESRTVTM